MIRNIACDVLDKARRYVIYWWLFERVRCASVNERRRQDSISDLIHSLLHNYHYFLLIYIKEFGPVENFELNSNVFRSSPIIIYRFTSVAKVS